MIIMNVKIKRLTETATIPTKAHSTDACFDIYADCPNSKYEVEIGSRGVATTEYRDGIAIRPGEAATIHTGFATDIPEGYFAAVFPRSGMGIKRHLRLSNGTGIIDSEFRAEWIVSLYNDGIEPQIIKHGDRIAQFTLLPVLNITLNEVEELDKTERGFGGLGSTGR